VRKMNRVIEWFFKYKNGTARTIEHDLYLAQPTVNKILHDLLSLGCIEELPRMRHEVMRGRPNKEFKLNSQRTKEVLKDQYNKKIKELESQIKTLEEELKKWNSL
jgi:predicted transcriptional regulator